MALKVRSWPELYESFMVRRNSYTASYGRIHWDGVTKQKPHAKTEGSTACRTPIRRCRDYIEMLGADWIYLVRAWRSLLL
jgi:hypothetical protein